MDEEDDEVEGFVIVSAVVDVDTVLVDSDQVGLDRDRVGNGNMLVAAEVVLSSISSSKPESKRVVRQI